MTERAIRASSPFRSSRAVFCRVCGGFHGRGVKLGAVVGTAAVSGLPLGGLFPARAVSKVIHRHGRLSPHTITSGLLSHSGNFDQFLYSSEPAFWGSPGGALVALEASC